MREESVTKQVGAAVSEGWMEGGSFFGSILSGTLLGLGLDWWLGTSPWLVVIGILLGSYSAFSRTWTAVKSQPDMPAVTLQRVDEDPQ
jgi:F0F1-type ATP synthase assembly protein I